MVMRVYALYQSSRQILIFFLVLGLALLPISGVRALLMIECSMTDGVTRSGQCSPLTSPRQMLYLHQGMLAALRVPT